MTSATGSWTDVSGYRAMLQLNRGVVESVEASDSRLVKMHVLSADGVSRPAIGYPAICGPIEVGDEVIVNCEALDLGLGSGGFDIVVVNLTRGLGAAENDEAHVMKLNYSPIQHAVKLLEEGDHSLPQKLDLSVCVLALHSQLSSAAYAVEASGASAGTAYVQTAGGALPGPLSDTVAQLRRGGYLDAHLTVSPCFGGQHESASVTAALVACQRQLDCRNVIVGPGPGIQGSDSALGHGGMAALDSAHAALALGLRPVLAPRLSGADGRPRHLGLSHHSRTVLTLLLGAVDVALAKEAADDTIVGQLKQAGCGERHGLSLIETDELFEGLLKSGLPVESMGRGPDDDPLFFRAALAAGRLTAEGT